MPSLLQCPALAARAMSLLSRCFLALCFGTQASVLAAGPAGGPYAIVSSVVGSGAQGLAGGNYSLAGTAGDLSRAPALGGGNYLLYPGFWTDSTAVPPPACLLDLDGNGSIDALTDGLMIIRALFGLTGASVTNGAVGAAATRTTWAQIQPMLNLPALDVDGNGTTDALTDGLLMLRAMFGLTGTGATAGVVGAGATRANWTAIRGYLNASCGTSFAP